MGSCLHCVSKPRRYKETTTRTAVGEGIENHTKGPTSSAQVQLKVNRNTNLHETHERFLNKEKMYRENLEKLQGQLSRLGRQIEQERIEHKSEHKRFAEILSRNNEENRKLKLENETLLTRLSAVASTRLTDGNANIADLSDVYRPTKLAEQYSELYDNEWTDAYDVIHKTETDEKACRILLELFCIIYQTCINKANHELDGVKDAIKTFLGGQDRGPPAEVIAKLKDQRKKNSADRKRALKQESRDKIMQILQSKALRNEQKMKQFLNKSISMCWLMAVQDPPVFIDVNYEECDKLYDSNVMKTYTKSGDYIDFLVWPPLFLHKDGNLLCKGVCQCKEVIGLHVSKKGLTSSLTKSEKRNDKGKKDCSEVREERDIHQHSIAAHDAITLTGEGGQSFMENREKQVQNVSVNGLESEEVLGSTTIKMNSVSEKTKGKRDRKKRTPRNDLSNQTKTTEGSILPTVTCNLQKTNEHTSGENNASISATTIYEKSSLSLVNTDDKLKFCQEETFKMENTKI